MNLPIVSVVIPVYNVERYIAECIESVLAQTYNHFEIICVNDGSSDLSVRIINSFQDSRIRIIHQKNGGLACARNTGINASRGLFVALLDADDKWAEEKLARHIQHFCDNPEVDVSYSPSLFMDEHSKPLGIGQFPKLREITPAHIYCRNPVGNGSAAVMRKSFLLKAAETVEKCGHLKNSYFDESMRQSEDIEFWIRSALMTAARFEGIPEPLTWYRVNSSGLSANLDKQFESWQYIADKNRKHHPLFFMRWQSMALAYQYRYLARRAINARNTRAALSMIHKAISTNIKIVIDEPLRTLVTYGCAWLTMLPKSLYSMLEKNSMKLVSAH